MRAGKAAILKKAHLPSLFFEVRRYIRPKLPDPHFARELQPFRTAGIEMQCYQFCAGHRAVADPCGSARAPAPCACGLANKTLCKAIVTYQPFGCQRRHCRLDLVSGKIPFSKFCTQFCPRMFSTGQPVHGQVAWRCAAGTAGMLCMRRVTRQASHQPLPAAASGSASPSAGNSSFGSNRARSLRSSSSVIFRVVNQILAGILYPGQCVHRCSCTRILPCRRCCAVRRCRLTRPHGKYHDRTGFQILQV